MKRFFLSMSLLLLLGAGCSYVVHTPEASPLADERVSESSVPLVDIASSTFDLPILAFHHVGPAPASLSESAKTWYISTTTFTHVLQTVEDLGYRPLHMSELLSYLDEGRIPEKAIVLSFDDGAVDFYTHAYPILQRFDMKASMHLQSHVRGKNWLTEEQIKEMHSSGLVEFNSHTKYHVYLSRSSGDVIREELRGSKEKIESIIGESVDVIAYPFGLYNETVIAMAKEVGYRAGLTIHAGTEQHTDELFEMRRILVTEQTSVVKWLE